MLTFTTTNQERLLLRKAKKEGNLDILDVVFADAITRNTRRVK